GQREPDPSAPRMAAAWIAKLPQPQPPKHALAEPSSSVLAPRGCSATRSMFTAVGRGVEEREALVGDVVVMARSARVTSRAVTPAAWAQLGRRDMGAVASACTRTPPQARAGR